MSDDDRTPQQIVDDRLEAKITKANNRLWMKIGTIGAIVGVLIPFFTFVFWAVNDRATHVDQLDHVERIQVRVLEKLDFHDAVLNTNALKLIAIEKDVSWMAKSMGKPDDQVKKP